MVTQADEIRANQQEIDRLLDRDRVYRDEIRILNETITAKDVVITQQRETIDAVHDCVCEKNGTKN